MFLFLIKKSDSRATWCWFFLFRRCKTYQQRLIFQPLFTFVLIQKKQKIKPVPVIYISQRNCIGDGGLRTKSLGNFEK